MDTYSEDTIKHMETTAKKINDALLQGKRVFLGPMDRLSWLEGILYSDFGLTVEFKPLYSIEFDLSWKFVTTELFDAKNKIGYEVLLLKKPDLQDRLDRIKEVGFNLEWKKIELNRFISHRLEALAPISKTFYRMEGGNMVWISSPNTAQTALDHTVLRNAQKEREVYQNTIFNG